MFKDKIVWITGASSGIGEELAKQLAQKGSKLILSARSEDKLNALNASLGGNHLVLTLDLANLSGIEEKVNLVKKTYGNIDYLFNNGGTSQRSNAADTNEDVERQIMEVNYFGTVKLTKAALPLLLKNGFGHIATISSIAGIFGFYQRSSYSASKFALRGYFESLRLEEEKNGLRVSMIFPGVINTPISKSAMDGSGNAHGKMDNKQANGMPVDVCVRKILKGIEKEKKDIFVGGKEMNIIWIKRFFPRLFEKLIRKQSPN